MERAQRTRRYDDTRVLVIDDETDVYELLEAVLAIEGMATTHAKDAAGALRAVADFEPHLIILDLGLPDCDGVTLCVELRRRFRGPIVVLTGRTSEESVVEALDAGADDYVTKPFQIHEFRARLRALIRRKRPAPESLDAGPFRLDHAKRRLELRGGWVPLTKTEFDVFALLFANRNRLVTADRLLQKFWGGNHGYVQTLRVHIGHIRAKIEDDQSEPKYLLTELGGGYRLEIPEDEIRPLSVASGAQGS